MVTTTQIKRRAILIFVLNRSGVLNKIAMLIRRKMHNVDTITACATQQPGISRMTITLREDNDDKTLQMIKQIEKMTEVISAKELDTNKSYWREAAIVKLEIDFDQLKSFQGRFNFEVLEKKNKEIQIVQVAGSTSQIDTFLDEIGRENIIEIARTGVAAMEK